MLGKTDTIGMGDLIKGLMYFGQQHKGPLVMLKATKAKHPGLKYER
jgi:hypothetical protein